MANSTNIDLGWYPPSQTVINNLTNVVSNGTTGVYGFIYNSSYTPDDEYGTYNWCNMPHVRSLEYVKPSEEYELAYVEVIHRHHKRTPYAANSFPVESYPWDCNDEGLFYFARPFSGDPPHPTTDASRNSSALAYWETFSGINPFEALASGWKGTCQFPQITSQGLDDAWQHGADLYGVYHDLLGFLPGQDDDDAWRQKVKYRVTNNVITSEVAGMVVNAMWNTTAAVPLLIQPDGVDSLEPDYTCAASRALYGDIESASNPEWEAHLEAARSLYATLDDISGVGATDSGFHVSFDHYYDNLSARQCHAKPLPCKLVNVTNADGTTTLANDTSACVTQALADEVYRFGNWEYSQIYRDSGAESLAASVGSFGVWIAELASHLRGVVDGSGDTLWFHNIAHDGSVSRLLGILQVDVMVWPGMGSEVVFEVWKRSGGSSTWGYYVRVLFSGQVLTSSNPSLGIMDMVPVETLLA
ncbi:Counting factor 60 [Cytospora mali]|uniref:Counting factor 60 n=1 Tax=Cytospora mali TaxID=578113 RepID=A0A194VFQ0_CYTMA|nr:Counting factor 60 [Valsa mali var. pyri (nom. inval.)]